MNDYIEENINLVDKLEKYHEKKDILLEYIETLQKYNISEFIHTTELREKAIKIIKRNNFPFEELEDGYYCSCFIGLLCYIVICYSSFMGKDMLKFEENISENIFEALCFYLLDFNGFDIVLTIGNNTGYQFMSNELFTKVVNVSGFPEGCFFVKFSNFLRGSEDNENEIFKILDRVYGKDYTNINIKKKKGKLYMIEGEMIDISEDRLSELGKKFPHAKVEFDIYNAKIQKKYKITEKIKLDK